MTTMSPTLRPRPRSELLLALLVAFGLLAAACSSGDDTTDQNADGTSSDASSTDEPDDTGTGDDPEAGAEDGDPPAGGDAQLDTTDENAPFELGRGVTTDTITIGYLYLDLDEVRERGFIDLNWGPQADHMQAIVDHINANGGINGRSIEVIPRAIDPLDAASAQAACLELTEDTEVFAVLGTLRRDEVLCYTEQHDTIAIANADMTQERLDRSTAPYVSVSATRERATRAFVARAADEGLFDGKTIAVLSVDAASAATDVAIPVLQDAGIDVELEVLIQGDGSVGGAAAELGTQVESMRARGIDAVMVVGDAQIPVNTFIGAGYSPTLFFTDPGAARTTAGRADMSVFPAAYIFGGPTAGSPEAFEETLFQAGCVAPWNAANPDLLAIIPSAVPDGEPAHGVGLSTACRALTIFRSIAEAAGENLNNDTFGAALETVGEVPLPGTGTGTLGDGKYDALDDLRLFTLNPNAEEDGQDFIEFG